MFSLNVSSGRIRDSPPNVNYSHVVGQKDEEISENESRTCDVKQRLLPTDLLHHWTGKYAAEKASQT